MGQLIKVKDKNGKYVLKVVNSSQPVYIVNNKKRKEQSNQTQKKDTWFQKGAFSDGYDIGDIAKTILGTTSDVGINIGKGIVNTGEGLGKMMVGGVAELSEALGNKEYSNKLKNRLAGKDENFNKKREKYLFSSNLDKLENKIDKFSLIGEKTDNIATGLGNIGASIAGQSVGIPWYATMGGSSVGHELENAYSNDATDQEAWISAGISGLSEVIFEKLSGGIKFGGKTLDESIKRPLLNKISNQTVKTLSNYGIDMFGEGAEEVLTEIASNVGRKLTYKSEETWKTALASEEALNSYIESFISGALVSGIINSGKTYQIVKESKRKQFQEQELINIEQTQQELENNFQKGIITEEQYNQEMNNLSNRLKIFTKEIKTNKTNPITEIEIEKQLLDEQFNNNLITEEEYNNSLSSLDESLKELSNNNQTLTNPNKIDAFRETANEYWDNSKESQEAKALIEKVIKDKGYNIILDPTIGNNIGGLATTNQNGEAEIRLNPNSNRTVEFLLAHEVTHAIETEEMKNLVMDYASKNTEFNKALESLKQTYNSEDVSSEVLADISGQLLGNQDFILNLSTTKPNVFKQMYDAIISFANKITGNSKEALFVRDLKNKWEKAYREQNNNLTTSKLSIQTDSNGKKYVNVDTDQNIFENIDIKEYNKIAKMYINDYLHGKTTLAENDSTIIDSKFASKYTNPGKKQPNFIEKMKLTPELKNVLKIAKKIKSKMPVKENSKYDSWEYYKFNFKIANQNFSGIVNIGIDKKGQKHFYEVNNIKKTSGISDISPNRPTGFSANTIPQSNKNVKSDNVSTKYSIQENINNTQGLDNSSFSIKELNSIINDKIKSFEEEGFVKTYGDNYELMMDEIYESVKNKTNKNLTDEDYDNINEIMDNFYDSEKEGYVSKKTKISNLKEEQNIINKINDSSDFIKNNEYIKEQVGYIENNIDKELAIKDIEKALPDLIKIDKFIDSLSKLTDINYIDTSKKSISTYIDVNAEALNNKTLQEFLIKNGYDSYDLNDFIEHGDLDGNLTIRISDHDVGGRYDMMNDRQIDYSGGDINLYLDNIQSETQELDNSSFSLEKLPKIKEGYTRLYRGLKGKYDANYDRSKLDSPNGYDTLTDNYELAKQYGDNVYYIDIPTNQISNSVIDENPNSETYGDRNLAYKDDKPAELNGISGNEYLLYTDHDNFNSQDYHEISEKTTNNDTKYSTDNKSWQKFLEDNYKATGKRTNMADIRQKTNSNTNTNTKSKTSQNKNLLPINKEVKKAVEPIKKDITDISKQIAEIRKALGIKNPTEISKLTKEDANTTPKLPNKKVSTGSGDSSFFENVTKKTKMLSEKSRDIIKTEDDVAYYEKVTNEESLSKAMERLDTGGKNETLSWFNKDSRNADSTDVAEGWILLKQYQDAQDYDSMVEVAKKMREIGTKAGQTVQAFNIMERLTPEGMVKYAQSELSEAYDKMIKNKTNEWIEQHRSDFDLKPAEVEFIMKNMEDVSKMEDGYDKRVKLAEIQKLVTDKLPPERGAGIKAWMRISMLFNPKTQVRNIVGNALISPVNVVGDTFASMIDRQIAKKTGIRTTGVTNLKNYAKGMKEGLYQSYNDFKKGINTRNIQGNRFEIGEGKSFNDKKAMGKALNRVDSMLSFMLDAGDRTFYEASFTNSINNQLVLNKTDTVTQDMIDIATEEALSRTWQDNNKFTQFVLRTRKGLNNLAGNENFGLGDVLIPFAKTPANLTKALIDYSPAGMISTITKGVKLNRSLKNGQYNPQIQHQFVQSLGKATAGTMLYVLGYSLAKAGITSGDGDDDKDVANFLKNTLGINNYSIKIGDKSFTYDWAQPVAGAFSIMANMVNSEEKEKALLEAIVGNLDTAGAILLEQSFMQSINDVLNNNDGMVSGLVTEILELPSRALPTFSKQIADMIDGTQRTSFEKGSPIKTSINQVKAKLPFVSKTLAPSVDSLGREIQKYGGKNNVFNVFFNPANLNSENVNEAGKELYRLYKETGDKTVMPRVVPYTVEINGEKKDLSSVERAKYQKESGKIVEEEMNRLLKSSKYTKLSNEEKVEVTSDIINYAYNKIQEKMFGKEIASEYKNADKFVSKGGTIADYYRINNNLKWIENEYEYKKDLLNENSSNYASNSEKLSSTKRKNIINSIINENINKEAKAFIYNKYYGSETTTQSIVNSGINFNEYLKFVRTDYKSDKDSEGNTIKDSRKKKVFNAINKLNLNKVEKAMLVRLEYTSFDDYNYQIFKHIDDLNLSKKQKEAMFETFGFEVKGGRVYW